MSRPTLPLLPLRSPATAATLACAIGLALGLVPAAASAAPQGSATVSAPGVERPTHRLAGDFNGDGFDDYVTTIDTGYTGGGWTATVVFGSASLANLSLATNLETGRVDGVGSRGVQIRPASTSAQPSYSNELPTAVGVGDVDRDGYDDLAISSPTRNAATDPHRAYVVHGGPGTAAISLADTARVTTLTLTGGSSDVRTDGRVSPVGDFDGDGYDDLAVTRSTGTNAANTVSPGAAIVRGGARTPEINATTTSSRVSLLTGQRICVFSWTQLKNICSGALLTLTGIGDFNGDGRDDIVFDNGRENGTSILLGRTGTFTASAGSVKLDGATLARTWTSSSVAAVGDVTGDGLADLGFRGPQAVSGANTMAVLTGRRSPGSSIALSGATPITSASRSLLAITGAGDGNRDGRDEVAIVTATLGDTDPMRRDLRITPVATTAIALDGVAPVAGLPTENVDAYRDVTVAGGGADFDRDGLPDLLYADSYGPTMTVVTSGADRAAPELFPAFSSGDDPDSPSIRPGIRLEPFDFTPASGTTRSVWVREAATVEFAVLRAADRSLVGSESRSVPAGRSSHPWNGQVGGATLPAGRYLLDVTPRDAAGNRGATIRYRFGVVSGGQEAGSPATTSFGARMVTSDGIVGHHASVMSANLVCPAEYGMYGLTPTPRADGALRRSGQICVVTPVPTETFNRICDDHLRVTLNGQTQPMAADGSTSVRLVAGENTIMIRGTCHERPASGPIVGFGQPGWVVRGDAYGSGNPDEIRLGAEPGETGSTVWNAPVDLREKTIEFATYVNGGSGTTEGVALALLPAAQTSPVDGFIGAGGARLGVGGLPATILAVDLTKGPGDARAPQVGLAQGTSATGLNWLATADTGVKVNEYGRWTTFKLVSKGGQVSVYVDGALKLSRAMALPSPAYLAFTGATSAANFQEQYLGRLKVTDS